MTTLLSDNFQTDLGAVQTFIQSDKTDKAIMNGFHSATTPGHQIMLKTFELQNSWIPATMHFENSIGWRWFIEKINDSEENLHIRTKLIDPVPGTTWSIDSGENLDAIEIENKYHQLHIGTEDGEMMQARAQLNNWMPSRFQNEISIERSFTEYIDFGFKTSVPCLHAGERIYFHYLVATNMIKQSTQYPGERDVSTWYAVEQTKQYLDTCLENKSGR